MNRVLSCLAVAAAALTASAASAATVYATGVTGIKNGVESSCFVAGRSTLRSDLCNALGTEDVDGDFRAGGFLSAANYDALIFTFDALFDGPLVLWEVTYNTMPHYIEELSFTFESSFDTNVGAVSGVVRNVDGTPDGPHRWEVVTAQAAVGPFDRLVISDISNLYGTRDGFDIDALSVQSVPGAPPEPPVVPLPAGLVLLATALGGLSLTRRR